MPVDQRTCYRCDERVDDTHQIRLTSSHEGEHTGRFQDADRRICLDCLAAIGMLELNKQTEQDEPSLGSRLSPVRSLRGGD